MMRDALLSCRRGCRAGRWQGQELWEGSPQGPSGLWWPSPEPGSRAGSSPAARATLGVSFHLLLPIIVFVIVIFRPWTWHALGHLSLLFPETVPGAVHLPSRPPAGLGGWGGRTRPEPRHWASSLWRPERA